MTPPVAPPAEAISSQPSSRRPSIYLQDRRVCRGILVILAVVVVVGMVTGIIFVAHYYFHTWGGQGFLRRRELDQKRQDQDTPRSCLPLRQLARKTQGSQRDELKRYASILPFYECGDQQYSCEAFNQPNICCPVGMSCHSTSYTNSNTYCCDSNITATECQSSASKPPQCPPSTFECAVVVGGGCCVNGTTCSPNGCIEFDGSGTPPPMTSTFVTTITYTTASKAMEPSFGPALQDSATDLTEIAIVTTITMVIGGPVTPTATVHKQGQAAQKAEGSLALKSRWRIMEVNLSPLMMLVVFALGMLLL